MDRFILELKLPIKTAYFKICTIMNEINELIDQFHQMYGKTTQMLIHPLHQNVCFASTKHKWLFTLTSFQQLYLKKLNFK